MCLFLAISIGFILRTIDFSNCDSFEHKCFFNKLIAVVCLFFVEWKENDETKDRDQEDRQHSGTTGDILKEEKRTFQESSRAFHSLRCRDSSYSLLSHRQALQIFQHQVIERRRLQSERIDGLEDAPSVELQLESATHSVLSKEIAEKTQELRQLRGEDLQGLNLDQLKQLEKLVQGGLSQVTETKDERFLKEISTLEKKGEELKEENLILKQQMENLPLVVRGQPSEPFPHLHKSGGPPPPQGYNTSDISLTLGLPFPN
ncbi:MADS-box protein SVP-like isoform X2 [Gossypium arboreum]|uniref:MADS-box protein SVP-like isoform X2 n=1 Tax=Gossypium arboreum TaxID=29729 RepID=UPI0022F1AA75|nr:MADS-box protein SVP-like isoform X2 [Gossypium arboreum]